ncbi:Peroxiredoxin [Caldanaerovirga acetigignens]|uniref:Peroxiredoxin n=1 Tax=Caldanaerovirga acetigignens TaxID=447595 RepID=A0A1M7KGW4_9FIRM|nr:TlpA disulfide reductase family protein [Caldanaerovirga acetigignens]SHM64534.1 Peroxiredoxin [Caldanaerovirga acetigignens]
MPLKKKKALLFLVLAFLTVFSLAGCQTLKNENTDTKTKPYEGYPAPDFELKDLSGKTVHLSDFRGKMVVLNFWSLNCSFCLAEMPDFEEFYRSKSENVEVLLINLDRNAEKVRTYIQNRGFTFNVLLDEKAETVRSYLIRGVPTTFLVDEDGVIMSRIEGQVSREVLDSMVQSACGTDTPT